MPPVRHGYHARLAVVLVGAWLVVATLPAIALWNVREPWLRTLEAPEAQADWDEFRRDMAGHTGREGPVQRKVPKSPEPPLRVWLRDYVGLAIVVWFTFTGVMAALLALLLWGSETAVTSRGRPTR